MICAFRTRGSLQVLKFVRQGKLATKKGMNSLKPLLAVDDCDRFDAASGFQRTSWKYSFGMSKPLIRELMKSCCSPTPQTSDCRWYVGAKSIWSHIRSTSTRRSLGRLASRESGPLQIRLSNLGDAFELGKQSQPSNADVSKFPG